VPIWPGDCVVLKRSSSGARGPHREDPRPITSQQPVTREIDMAKLWAVVLTLVAFLLVAPVIESGTSESSVLFQAIGTAEGGGGAG
jgi:hypothetical protein